MASPLDEASLLKGLPAGKPLAVILAGHNGSGKSTLWKSRLSDLLRIPLLNADRLTLSILPEAPAGDLAKLPSWARALRDDDERWQLISQGAVSSLVDKVLEHRVSFAYETVFSHIRELPDGTIESKAQLIDKFQKAGYSVALIFVGLTNSALSTLRVETRQRQGGHSVPENKLLLRFPRTQRVVQIAAPLADLTLMFDNSRSEKEAFSLVRAQLKNEVLYDCRLGARGEKGLLAVASPWLNVVAPVDAEEPVR